MLITIIRWALIIWCGLNSLADFFEIFSDKPKKSSDRFANFFYSSCYILVILFLTGVLK